MISQTQLSRLRSKASDLIQQVFPATIQVAATAAALATADELSASTGGLRRGDGLAIGGFIIEDEISFRVRKSLFAELPQAGHRVRWVEGNVVFRIETAKHSDSDPCIHLKCTALEK